MYNGKKKLPYANNTKKSYPPLNRRYDYNQKEKYVSLFTIRTFDLCINEDTYNYFSTNGQGLPSILHKFLLVSAKIYRLRMAWKNARIKPSSS